MNFPAFLEVSYALLAEEHQRIDPLKDLLRVSSEVASASSRPLVRTTVAAQNQQSMAALKAQMSGVQGSPI